MRTKTTIGFLMAAATGAAGLAVCQQVEEMDARDMFYSAGDLLGRKPPVSPVKKQGGAVRPPVREDAGRQQPEVAAHRAPPKDPEQYFRVSAGTERPLGLRYSLLREVGGSLVESAAGTEYHSGDLIRLSVMGNQKSYVYVVSRGSSGVWSPLYPNRESAQRSNEIVPGRAYQIPSGPGEYFRLDKGPGEERIFILLSRQPVTDMEGLIRRLDAGEERPQPVLRASAQWNDDMIAGLRETVARDLVFTKVDEQPAGPGFAGDKAIYVVNRNSAQGDRTVADVILAHR